MPRSLYQRGTVWNLDVPEIGVFPAESRNNPTTGNRLWVVLSAKGASRTGCIVVAPLRSREPTVRTEVRLAPALAEPPMEQSSTVCLHQMRTLCLTRLKAPRPVFQFTRIGQFTYQLALEAMFDSATLDASEQPLFPGSVHRLTPPPDMVERETDGCEQGLWVVLFSRQHEDTGTVIAAPISEVPATIESMAFPFTEPQMLQSKLGQYIRLDRLRALDRARFKQLHAVVPMMFIGKARRRVADILVPKRPVQ